MLRARIVMLVAAGLASLVVLSGPSTAAADAGRHGSGPDATSSTWSTSPLTATYAALGPGRAGHQDEQLYPSNSPRPTGSPLPVPRPAIERSSSRIEGSWDYAQIALGGLAGVVVAAVVVAALNERRRRRPLLEAALATGGPGETSRAAGLLGDSLVRQRQAGAAEHAYRAAIEVGHEYWTPIAQLALARLLSDRGDFEEALVLRRAVVASGHYRAVPVAQAGLGELSTDADYREAVESTAL
jgi:hypothetical protein